MGPWLEALAKRCPGDSEEEREKDARRRVKTEPTCLISIQEAEEFTANDATGMDWELRTKRSRDGPDGRGTSIRYR